MEQVLERFDVRMPVRTLAGPTRAMSMTVAVRAIDVVAGSRSLDLLPLVATVAIANFLEQGALAVIRPGHGPTFLFPLPSPDDGSDEVASLCQQLDDDQLRQRATACASRFRSALEPQLRNRGLLLEVHIGEGTIAGTGGFVGMLLPSLAWRPA